MPPGKLFRRVAVEHGEELRKDPSIAASACSGATIVVALRRLSICSSSRCVLRTKIGTLT